MHPTTPARRNEVSATVIGAVAASFGRDLDRCLAQIGRTLAVARERGARLLVFPECALGGYVDPAAHAALRLAPLLRPDGPEISAIAGMAGSMVVCVGYTEDGPHGPCSSAVCVSGDGVLGHHRKVHVPPSETDVFHPGDGFHAFDTPVGRVGMLICYDKVFPEAARSLALDGAEIVASLAAWPLCRMSPAERIAKDLQTRHFNLLDQARAVDNQVVWVSANLSGEQGGLRFVGNAKVVDAEGRVLTSTGGRAGTALAEVDLSSVGVVRGLISHLRDRRPHAYRLTAALTPAPAAA
jgi:N-carbamoylputrescine amidase